MIPNTPISLESKNKEGKRKLALSYAGFLASYADSSKKMIHSYIGIFSRFLKQYNISIDEVDQNIVNLYQDATGRKDISNGTYNLRIGYIKCFLSFLGKNFIYKYKHREPYGNIRIINEDDFKLIIHHLEKSMKDKTSLSPSGILNYRRYLRDFIIFSLFYLSGLRKSELTGLKHKDVFVEGGDIFYKTDIKGSREIKKQFPVFLYNYINELKQIENKTDDCYIFTSVSNRSSTKMLSNAAPNKFFMKYFKSVTGKNERVTIHGIRNISGLAVFEETKDILITKDHLNHFRLNTTQIYLEKGRERKSSPYNSLINRLDLKQYAGQN